MYNTQSTIPLLSPINPLDYLRLLWWTLVMPQKLKRYQEQHGKEAITPTGAWLTSTLTWLPLLLSTFAMGLEAFSRSGTMFSATTYFSMSGGYCIAWLLTGFLAGRDDSDMALAVVLRVVFGVVLGVAGVVVLGMTLGVVGVVVLGALLGVANAVAGIVALGVAHRVVRVVMGVVVAVVATVVAFIVAFGAAFVMANIMGVSDTQEVGAWGIQDVVGTTIDVVFSAVVGVFVGAVALIFTLMIALIVAKAVARVVAKVIEKSIESGNPSWLGRGAFGALVVAYAFLLWFCFFGGWQAFA